MKPYGIVVLSTLTIVTTLALQCDDHEFLTFSRWSGFAPDRATPVFVYSASGEEESLTGACLSRCRELQDCAAVVVAYERGNCQGIADSAMRNLKANNDVAYFKKICLEVPRQCNNRWWSLESTPGYHLHSDSTNTRVLLNTTLQDCYKSVTLNNPSLYRSSQWVGLEGSYDSDITTVSDSALGNCILNSEDKFSEPESYRVSNYFTIYTENQCRHDYPKKIDRCSYEEYNNQTLKHVEITIKNYTKDECKLACENEDRFVCRGFTWTSVTRSDRRGLCDLHSEDLITTGSWLLRRTTGATYYRRVICLNITVECEGSNLIVTYRPRGVFRGRVYVPGRGEQCSARADGNTVRLPLPLYGECDVNFAYAISNGPNGVINRTMAYVMVMVQNNPIIQTAGDRWVRVGCSPGGRRASTAVDALVAVKDTSKPSLPNSPSASAVLSTTSPLSMYVLREDDAGASAGQVPLGEPLHLIVDTTDVNEMEAYHLIASSRLGDSSVLLLDNRGCPTGKVDFPSFTRTFSGGTQRLSARFKAFRFPTSHVVRFSLMIRFCDGKCPPLNCNLSRSARMTNDSLYEWATDDVPASVTEEDWGRRGGVVSQGGVACGGEGRTALEVEVVVGAKDIISADTLVHADHRIPEESTIAREQGLVCVHELLLLALALAWLAVQVVLLLGCCVLVKRYRNLAEMNMQKDYHSFDNVGFDTISTHRRVHWPDQNIEILHTT